MSKIIGVTVGTPTSPQKMEQEINPVKSVNGVLPDENGNVEVKGDPYTLTAEDKASIVADVLSAMPVAEELSV